MGSSWFWQMVNLPNMSKVKKVPYLTDKQYLFLDQKGHLKLVTRIRKQITKFDIKPEQLGLATT